jgi:hypothetical protein
METSKSNNSKVVETVENGKKPLLWEENGM